jgi:hypothetical protein
MFYDSNFTRVEKIIMQLNVLLDVVMQLGKRCYMIPLFSGVCRNTPSNRGFAKYHYNFVTLVPEHTALIKTENLTFHLR